MMRTFRNDFANFAKGGIVYASTGSRPRYARSYTGTRVQRRKRVLPKTSFKSMVLSTQPAKHYTGFPGVAAVTHGTVNTAAITGGIVQGTADNNREGDSITMCALKMNGYITTPTASGAYTYRILVGYSGEEFPWTANFGSGLGLSEIFLPFTTSGAVTNGVVNPKAFNVLYDERVDINSVLTGVRDLHSIGFTVPFNNTKFPYQASTSQYGKLRNLYVIFIGDVVGGVTGVTDCGTLTTGYDLVFK